MPYQYFDPSQGYPGPGQYYPNQQYNNNFDPTTGRQGPTGDVGNNPYPWNRYAFAGPQFDAANGAPNNNLYGGYDPYYGNSLDAMTIGNRNMAQAGGISLQRDLNNYTNFNYGQAGNFQDKLNSAYDPIAQGQGGYSQGEKEAILNNPALQGLRMTPEQQQAMYLNEGEQAGISGNPYQAFDYSQGQGNGMEGRYNDYSGQIGADLGSQESSINSTLQGNAANIRNPIYDYQNKSYNDLSDIAALTRGEVGNTRSNVRNSLGYSQGLVGGQLQQTGQRLGSALESEAQGVRSYIDPRALTTSDEYNTNYQVGPQDMQGIMNQAGRQVGAQSAMDEENLAQSANAQGNTSPLALSAMRDRIRLHSSVDQANAMSDAAVKAKQLQLNTSQGRENTRLGAEQAYAGMGAGAEMGLGNQQVQAAQQYGNLGTNAALGLGNQAVSAEYGLGQQGLSNEQYMGSNTLAQQNALSAAQLGAEQYLGSQNLAGQQYLGNSRLNNTQQLMNTGLGVQQFNTNTGLGALQTGEQNASNRAGTLATNRQGVNQYNNNNDFTRGQYIYGQGANANTNFANTRLGQEQEYRGYLTGGQNQANQNVTIGNQQRLGAYGATNQGAQGATGQAIENYKIPGFGNTVFNDVGRVLGFAKGGEMKGPQPALIGENGPELLIDLAPSEDAKPKSSYASKGILPCDEGFDPNDYASTMYGDMPNDVPQSDNSLYRDDLVPQNMPGSQVTHRKRNPLYDKILGTLAPNYAAAMQPPAPVSDTSTEKGSGKQGGGGLLGTIMRFAALAGGGVAGGHHYYGNRSKLGGKSGSSLPKLPGLPKISLVTKPHVTVLGAKGPQAVVPLTPRKSNKLNVSDIPSLIKKYNGR